MSKEKEYCFDLMKGLCEREPSRCWFNHDLPPKDSVEYQAALMRMEAYDEAKRNQMCDFCGSKRNKTKEQARELCDGIERNIVEMCTDCYKQIVVMRQSKVKNGYDYVKL